MNSYGAESRTVPILFIMVIAWFGITFLMTHPTREAAQPVKETSHVSAIPVPIEKPKVLSVMIDQIQHKTAWPEPSRQSENYPIPAWARTIRGDADVALILAIAHQESRFNPNAVSPRGAVGLMQIIPSTAKYITKMPLVETSYASASGATPALHIGSNLRDPHTNIRVGQKYIQYLKQQPYIGNNLIYILAAYNAGPGALEQWKKRSSKDPIRFINSIPYDETREYVKKVMTNYWIYRAKLGKKDHTMMQIIEGKMPTLSKV